MTAEGEFSTTPFRYNNIQYIHTTQSSLDFDPPYQRQSEIWSRQKRQLLIDSIFNEFDIPKFYLHRVAKRHDDGRHTNYALIDGKQRLNAVLGFMENEFPLARDFELFNDKSLHLGGYTYSALRRDYPHLSIKFASTPLDIVVVETNDVELIEEMFYRLNEAVPLNAAEKRNAIGGPLPTIVRNLSDESFFVRNLPFSNSRYRHFDLAAKFLYWTEAELLHGEISRDALSIRDTKKVRLDGFFKQLKEDSAGQQVATDCRVLVTQTLSLMAKRFSKSDPLLRSLGMVSVYYLYFLRALKRDDVDIPERPELALFDVARQLTDFSEDDLKPGDFQFLEFARLSQSPNDGNALRFRLLVLETWVTAFKANQDPEKAVARIDQ